MAKPSVYIERTYDDRVWTIVLNRPNQRNAVNGPTARLLHDAFLSFNTDTTAQVAVLWGANGTFCAGADLKAISSKDESNPMQPHGIAPMVSKTPPQRRTDARRALRD